MKIEKEACLAKDLGFILSTININISRKKLTEIANKDEDFERILTSKVLKYGKNTNAVKAYLQKHVSQCDKCYALYCDFLENQAENDYEFYELDREYLNLLKYQPT